MSVKEMYEYVYYKVYKSVDFVGSWGADWRASAILLGFEAFIPLSLIFYYRLLFPYSTPISDVKWFLFPGVILSAIDHYTFHSKNQWKGIIEKYDAWPSKKNFRGTLIVWSIIFLVVANFILAINLYEQVDWSQYHLN